MRELLARDASARTREAALTMAAVLLSFASAYALRRAAGLSPSLEVLGVALALSLSRTRARPELRHSHLLGLLVLPVVAVGASEIGELLFREPTLGDTLFVLAVAFTIWVRRFGDRARRMATFMVLPVISVLIVPAPAVAGLDGSGTSRWWAALVAVIALAWVSVIRLASPSGPAVVPARAGRRRPWREGESRFRLPGSTKLAIQMGVALAGAFALGRWLFDPHWAWCVLSAFIVSSGNRGRVDVLHKATMRVLGAGAGTLVATLLAGLFPTGDAVAIVVVFAILAIALWLRPLNYAFWAMGMTAALALLYGYYGEHGVSLIGSRLEGILLGAALGVAAAWLLWPIRTTDVMRRDIGAALAALERLLLALSEEADAVPDRVIGFRRAVAALEYHRTLLSTTPRRLRAPIDHLPALDGLARLTPPASETPDRAALGRLRREVGVLRRANGDAHLPDPRAWTALADHVAALSPDSSETFTPCYGSSSETEPG